ncbi:glutamate 5-kinase [Synoicihabitans lomoniglobus]|uniref:Glutamate 5-kinase n=1 Tax=Synoicihabitans lomoniglobus TaxID=2909285 RepID=A0AAF0CPV5_9BACT|nr:glutamate 5-kinase [Opitutaceae bacterium LMO-M01]WED65856.1 glutamate 5-kinase [Opitutaceae bacterium LMO-M01]
MSIAAKTVESTPPKRVVVKLGTGVLTSGIGQLDIGRIASVCRQISDLGRSGTEVIVVSSGAVGLGMGRLGLARRPSILAQKQACAAVGQSLLMQTWQRGFEPHHRTVAEVLLTREDMRARSRHLALKASVEALIGYGTIPIINENDAVSGAEIQFGDNDTLSAMLASLVHADYLVILSTAPGLIDMEGTGNIVPTVTRITPEIEAMAAGTTSITAVGGMVSKISAARIATKAGCGVFIASGAEEDVLPKIFSGHNPGTFFVPAGLPLDARKRWLTYFQRPAGCIEINTDAVPALQNDGGSLLAVGVTGSRGPFAVGDIVNIAGPDGTVIARGKCRFSNEDILRIAGLNTREMKPLFPGRRRLEVVHRNDLVLL